MQLFQQNYDLQAKVAELQQLAELSQMTRLQNDAEQTNTRKLKNEQLENQMQNLKLELANAIAMKVDTDEACRESIKKYDQQNVELHAIQELYKNATAEIASLKAQNESARRELEHTKYVMAEQTSVIQAQVRYWNFFFKKNVIYQTLPTKGCRRNTFFNCYSCFHFSNFQFHSVTCTVKISNLSESNVKRWLRSVNK